MILYAAMDPVPYPKGAAQRIEATLRALPDVRALTLQGQGVLEGIEHTALALDGQENFLDRALAFRAEMRRQLERHRPDVVWVRSIWEGVPALEHRGRLVYEVHGFPSIELPHHFPQLTRHPELVARMIDEEQALLRRADLLVVPSVVSAHFLRRRGVDPAKVRILPNSVEDHHFAAEAERPDAPFRLLYAGTLAPWQGLETLLEALALLKNEAVVLQLVGPRKGPWLRRLRRLAQSLRIRSRLELTGPRLPQELPALYASAHVCVAPLPGDARNSLQGCCPIKLLEYMAAGQPILSTRVPSVEEILTHQETAWLVQPGSPRALADGIRWLRAHPLEAAQMGQAARSLARQRYHRQQFQATLRDLAAGLTR